MWSDGSSTTSFSSSPPEGPRPGTVRLPDPAWIIGKTGLMNIRAAVRNGRTEIEPRSWRIPFQWQGVHHEDHDDQAFLLLINSAGGFVEGDVAKLYGVVEEGARVLLTTTAASKFYKCLDGLTSHEEVELEVGGDALLEYYPDEAIPFARARANRTTRIELQPGSSLFATDMISAGRIAYGAAGEAFAFDALRSEFTITVAGKPVFSDRLIVAGEDEVGALRRLWGGANHLATVVGWKRGLPAGCVDDLIARLAAVPGVRSGVSMIGDLVVVRLLAEETWRCHDAIFAAWSVLRPHLAGKPAKPIRKC